MKVSKAKLEEMFKKEFTVIYLDKDKILYTDFKHTYFWLKNKLYLGLTKDKRKGYNYSDLEIIDNKLMYKKEKIYTFKK